MTRLPKNRVLFACVLVVLSTALSGCFSSKAELHKMDGVAAGVQQQLLKVAGVASAEVLYQDNLNAAGSVAVRVMVGSGVPVDPVVEEATRLVWQSSLEPLSVISVQVYDGSGKREGFVQVHRDPKTERADLERKYGKRPV